MPHLYKILFDFWTRLKSGSSKIALKRLEKPRDIIMGDVQVVYS